MADEQKTLEGKAQISFMQKGKDFLVGLLGDIKIQTRAGIKKEENQTLIDKFIGMKYYQGVIFHLAVGALLFTYFYNNSQYAKPNIEKELKSPSQNYQAPLNPNSSK